MSPPDDLERLSYAGLKGLVIEQWEQLVELQRTVAALREEVARLEGGPGRPNLKPSGMEWGTDPKPPGSPGERKRPREACDPRGTDRHGGRPAVRLAFQGYTSFVVRDLVIRPHVVNFRCERWQTPDGDMVTVPLPAGIDGLATSGE